MVQIKIKNLTFAYPDMDNPVLKEVNLDVEEGEFVVICGESGCGKSTLLRNLKPAIRPFGHQTGEVFYNGIVIDELDDRVQASEIGFIMQNPEHQIVTDKVWHEMAFGLENLGYGSDEIRLRVVETAEYFGITDWYFKDIDKLSGGQKQLLNLASTMTMYPKVMILDEPTAQLDPIAAQNFIDALKKINQELGITIIVIEHRLEMVLQDTDKLVVMKDGKIILSGNPKDVISELEDENVLKLMPTTVQLYKKYDRGDIVIPLSVSQGRRWFDKLTMNANIEKRNNSELVEVNVETRNNEESVALDNDNKIKYDEMSNKIKNISSDESARGDIRSKNNVAILCKNLWFRYERNDEDVIKGLNLKISKGEIFAILGGNGTGKTTAVSLLAGINKPYRGKIALMGKVAVLPQDVQTLFRKDKVELELQTVPEEIIRFTRLSNLMNQNPHDLSGGQQQKLALAKVLAVNPDILILDEPTNGLDAIDKENLLIILKELKEVGKTIIIVSHDVDFCGDIADRCGMFAYGNIIAQASRREFFSNNRFYTTTVSKITKNRLSQAINREDVECFLMEENII